jgi:hypothetical protein
LYAVSSFFLGGVTFGPRNEVKKIAEPIVDEDIWSTVKKLKCLSEINLSIFMS